MALAQIPTASFHKIAIGIDRPEDVVVLSDGRIFAADHQCAVAEIHSDGSFTRLGPQFGAPNGINALPDGRIIIANFGIYDQQEGPLERFDPVSGVRETLLCEVEGQRLTSANYPMIDRGGNIWCANSTHASTWPEALDGRADGFIFVLHPDGTSKIVATGLKFPNGLALSADGAYLYCCQTSAANVLRFPILNPGPQASLGPGEVYGCQLGALVTGFIDDIHPPTAELAADLGYTDGCGMDQDGNLWVTLPAANKIIAIRPDQSVFVVVHDREGEIVNHPTNVAWGGDDLRDLYVGSIRADYVLKARSPVAGAAMVHQSAP